jgi:hypothetical protein
LQDIELEIELASTGSNPKFEQGKNNVECIIFKEYPD